MTTLNVWMGDECIGALARRGKEVVFSFSEKIVATHPASPLISVAMLVRAAPWRGAVPEAFFGGLLPEGEVRRMLAHDFRIDDGDDLELLRRIGRDCAGALQVLPESVAPATDGGSLELLSEEQVAARLRSLRFSPLGVDNRVRVSLAGMQEKMVLVTGNNGWSLPLDGAPSTHILKPPHAFLAHSVANEALCMRIAHHAGVLAADVSRSWFAGCEALIVKRYDRERVNGQVRRIHQEDLCQAHALPANRKYEENDGPTLESCASLIRDWTSGNESMLRLLDLVTINVAVGNADAHTKNFSLLHHRSGIIELAPAYDIMSTLFYPQVNKTLGMYVNGVSDIERVTFADVRKEALGWGLPPGVVDDRMGAVIAQLPTALEAAVGELDPPIELAEWLGDRFVALCGEGVG